MTPVCSKITIFSKRQKYGRSIHLMQNVRGGRIVLKPIDAPAKQSWDSAVEAMQDAIELEKTVNQVMVIYFRVTI